MFCLTLRSKLVNYLESPSCFRAEGRDSVNSPKVLLGELGSMKSLSCREVDDYFHSTEGMNGK
jgi:hypothetical protein